MATPKYLSRRAWLAAGAAACAVPRGWGRAAAGKAPNIILIVADDLGYGDLGCYGNRVIRTPHIDRLAAQGVRFTDFAVSWPACTPSRGSILTGRYPQRNGLYDMIRNQEVNWKYQFTEETYAVSPEMTLGMDLREITLGQALRAAGYATAAIGKWDGGRARRFLPTQRGFDSFFGFANTGIDYYTHERYGIPSMFRNNERIKETGHATDLFHREASRFLAERHGRPFFLYLAFNAPHMASTFDKQARQAPEEYLRMYPDLPKGRRLEYAALVTHMDAAIGGLMEQLRRQGQEENTLVVFVSDNGGGAEWNNGGLRGGKAKLFEGGLRVPLIARWPGRVPAGAVRRDFATTLEFFPTFLAAAGARPDPAVKLDGFNLLPVMAGDSSSPRKEMFWQRQGDKAARVGHWKWVEGAAGSGLFDLAADVGETKDLSAARPDVLAMMRARWQAWRKEMDACEPRGPFRDY